MPEAQAELHVFTFGLRPGDRVTRADGREWRWPIPRRPTRTGRWCGSGCASPAIPA
jgi:hypothetical protein